MDEKLRQEIQVILRRDGKIAALTALRGRTGMNLNEAKTVIDELPTASNSSQAPRPTIAIDEKLRQEIQVILRRDGKIAALTALRGRTGMNLGEANAAIDALPPASKPPGLPGKLLDLAADFELESRSPAERARLDEQAVSRWGQAAWDAAVAGARRLAECSYDLCDRARNGEFSTGEVQERLRQTCPGFSEDIYSLAFERGMIASR